MPTEQDAIHEKGRETTSIGNSRKIIARD